MGECKYHAREAARTLFPQVLFRSSVPSVLSPGCPLGAVPTVPRLESTCVYMCVCVWVSVGVYRRVGM